MYEYISKSDFKSEDRKLKLNARIEVLSYLNVVENWNPLFSNLSTSPLLKRSKFHIKHATYTA